MMPSVKCVTLRVPRRAARTSKILLRPSTADSSCDDGAPVGAPTADEPLGGNPLRDEGVIVSGAPRIGVGPPLSTVERSPVFGVPEVFGEGFIHGGDTVMVDAVTSDGRDAGEGVDPDEFRRRATDVKSLTTYCPKILLCRTCARARLRRSPVGKRHGWHTARAERDGLNIDHLTPGCVDHDEDSINERRAAMNSANHQVHGLLLPAEQNVRSNATGNSTLPRHATNSADIVGPERRNRSRINCDVDFSPAVVPTGTGNECHDRKAERNNHRGCPILECSGFLAWFWPLAATLFRHMVNLEVAGESAWRKRHNCHHVKEKSRA